MKKAVTLLALICLTFAGFSFSTAQPVQAISKYSEKWHTVKTTKKVYAYKPYVPRGGACSSPSLDSLPDGDVGHVCVNVWGNWGQYQFYSVLY